LKNSKVVSFLSPFKVGQAGNLWTLPRIYIYTEINNLLNKSCWEDNIKVGIQDVGLEVMDWIALVQNRDRWQVFVSTMMNLWFQ